MFIVRASFGHWSLEGTAETAAGREGEAGHDGCSRDEELIFGLKQFVAAAWSAGTSGGSAGGEARSGAANAFELFGRSSARDAAAVGAEGGGGSSFGGEHCDDILCAVCEAGWL